MSDFKTIETQEQFDEAIKERIARVEKKYEKYISPEAAEKLTADKDREIEDLKKQIGDLGNSLNGANDKAKASAEAMADLEAKVKEYETASVKSRIAHEVGIPYELANRLSGETEDDIRKDAEYMKSFTTVQQAMPLRNPEAGGAGGTGQQFASWFESNML